MFTLSKPGIRHIERPFAGRVHDMTWRAAHKKKRNGLVHLVLAVSTAQKQKYQGLNIHNTCSKISNNQPCSPEESHRKLYHYICPNIGDARNPNIWPFKWGTSFFVSTNITNLVYFPKIFQCLVVSTPKKNVGELGIRNYQPNTLGLYNPY